MAGEVMTAANHVQNLIGIDAELTSSQVEKIWRILFVHPLYLPVVLFYKRFL